MQADATLFGDNTQQCCDLLRPFAWALRSALNMAINLSLFLVLEIKCFYFVFRSIESKHRSDKVRFSSYSYQTLLCRFEGLGREAVQAEQPGFVIGGTGTETIYQQTKWQTRLFSIWFSFSIVRFA